MLKIVAPALAVVAALYFMKNRKKDEEPDTAQEYERLTDMAAGAYPGE
jgi:hypothetical protein